MTVRAACALRLEEWAVRKLGVPTVRVGMRCKLGVPEGKLISVGVAGGLVPALEIGSRVTANRIVDEDGQTIWEGEPLKVPGAIVGTVASVRNVHDTRASRKALYESTGAIAVEMESLVLAGPLFKGCFRVISDTPSIPLILFSIYGGLAALRELTKIRLETELW